MFTVAKLRKNGQNFLVSQSFYSFADVFLLSLQLYPPLLSLEDRLGFFEGFFSP